VLLVGSTGDISQNLEQSMAIIHPKLHFSKPLTTKEAIDEHAAKFHRCEGCRLQRRLCMCDLEPRLATKVPLHLIIHYREMKRPTNSGLLAARCIQPSHVYVRGLKGSQKDVELQSPGTQPLLLFPSDKAIPITQDLKSKFDKPISLVVPDGNWNQASRMPKRIPSLKDLPHVSLPVGDEPEFRLRREENKPEGLSTLDAIARAYLALGEVKIHDELLKIYRVMAMRTLWSKGALSSENAAPYLP